MLPACPGAEEIIVLLIRQRRMTVLERKVETGLGFQCLRLDHQPLLSRPRRHWKWPVLAEDLEEAGSGKRLTKAKLQ